MVPKQYWIWAPKSHQVKNVLQSFDSSLSPSLSPFCFIIFPLFGGHTWKCSGFPPGSVLRGHSWWAQSSIRSAGNWTCLSHRQGKLLTLCTFSLAPPSLKIFKGRKSCAWAAFPSYGFVSTHSLKQRSMCSKNHKSKRRKLLFPS